MTSHANARSPDVTASRPTEAVGAPLARRGRRTPYHPAGRTEHAPGRGLRARLDAPPSTRVLPGPRHPGVSSSRTFTPEASGKQHGGNQPSPTAPDRAGAAGRESSAEQGPERRSALSTAPLGFTGRVPCRGLVQTVQKRLALSTAESYPPIFRHIETRAHSFVGSLRGAGTIQMRQACSSGPVNSLPA